MRPCEHFTGDPECLKGQVVLDIEKMPRRVEITWWDAWSDDGYYDREAIKNMPPALRKDIGYLIDEDTTTITLTSELIDISFTGEHRCHGIRIIYKGMIEGIIELEESMR